MRFTFLLSFCLLMFSSINAQELVGKVVDKGTGKPVSDAKVKLVGKSSTTQSKANGEFRLFISMGYPCLVEFSKSGYQTHVLNLEEAPEDYLVLNLVSLNIKETPIQIQDLNVYKVAEVDEKPVYPSCESKLNDQEQFDCFKVAMDKFLDENLRYSKAMKKKKLEGDVTVGFEIGIDGLVTNVEILKGQYEDLNNEAIRVVWSMPKMKPARKDGQDVKVSYQAVVNFNP